MHEELVMPHTREGVFHLQKLTTSMVRDRELLVAKNKLCAGAKSDAQRVQILAAYGNDAGILAAAGPPSATTQSAYMRRGRGLWHKARFKRPSQVWKIAEGSCGNKPSWYACKAALQFFLLDEMRTYKRAIDAWYNRDIAIRNTQSEQRRLTELFRQVVALGKALAAVPAPGYLPPKFVEAASPPDSRRSKSKSIRNRASDWRQRVAQQLSSDLKLLYLIQCISGCRPVELDKDHGASVFLRESGELLVTTFGAKLSKTAGQPARQLLFDTPFEGLTKDLADLLKPGVVVQSSTLLATVAGGKVANYRAAIARAGTRAFAGERAENRLTAYSARHQFMADLRAAGFSREKIAQAMGHRTVKSAVYYGRKGRGSAGGVVPAIVNATHEAKKRAPHPAERARVKKQATQMPTPKPKQAPVPQTPKARKPKP